MHDLYLDIKDTINEATFRVDDISIYIENAPFENPIIEVTPPTYDYPTLALRPTKNFSIVFNSSNLRIVPATGGVKSPLPDGNYYIKYSVAPNTSVWVAYNYFRNFKQVSSFKDLLCSIKNSKKDIPTRTYVELRKQIILLHQDIVASKYQAENNFEVAQALEMYKENDNQIDLLKKQILWYQK